VPDDVLVDLRRRLARTRLPDADDAADDEDEAWDAGTSPAFMRQLVRHWQTDFDWRAQEAAINRFAQFRTSIDGRGIPFIHDRGGGGSSLPLILTHGYPDSFLRFTKLIPLLTDPAAHGGDAADSFDVVVPSLPGFGFSQHPGREGAMFEVGDLW